MNNNTITLICNGPSVSYLNLPIIFSDFEYICVFNSALFHLDSFPRKPNYCFMNDSFLGSNKNIHKEINKEKDTEIIQTKNFNKSSSFSCHQTTSCDILSCAIDYFIKKDFNKIVLFGLDFNYSGANCGKRINNPDQHYKIKGKPLYKGLQWTFPDMQGKIKAMKYIKKKADKKNIQIDNATKNSKCNIFDFKYSEYSIYYE